MKRKWLLFCTAILLIFSLSGCVELPDGFSIKFGSSSTSEMDSTGLAQLQEEISGNGSAGIAFIGYVDAESTEADMYDCLADSKTGKKYSFLAEAPLVLTEGQELYAVVPLNEKGAVRIYPSAVDENGDYTDDLKSPLFTGKPGEAVLVRCNLSELYSNVLIAVTDGSSAIEFRPSLSMEDGRFAQTEGVYDFSVYEGASGDTVPGITVENPGLTKLREEINQNANIGAAFISYVPYEGTEEDVYNALSFSETGQEYPFLADAPLLLAEGQELYAIVPPNDEWSVTVYPVNITQGGTFEDDLSAPLFEGKPGEPVLVRCNVSVYPDVLVVVSDGFASVEFRPLLSMADGQMDPPGEVYDFSVYADAGSGFGDTGYDDTGYGDTAEDPGLKALREEILQNGSFGVAFIDYVAYDSTGEPLYSCLEYSATGQKYPFLSDATLCTADGQELYVIVPQAGERVVIYNSTMNENGEYVDDMSAPRFEGDPGRVVLLRCNVSEIYSNVLVLIKDDFGVHEFRPAISGEDGEIAESAGMYDFTVYEPYDPSENSFLEDMDYLCTFDEIQDWMKQGMKVLYTGETVEIDGDTCNLFAVGTDHEDQFVTEFHYAVCGEYVYSYDVISDTWNMLAAG